MKKLRYFTFIIIFLLLTSCAHFPKMGAGEKQLEQQVSRIMEAKINGKWDQVYEMFCTNYRKSVKKSSFLHFNRIKFISYRIHSVDIDDDGKSAVAQVYISFSSKGFTFPESIKEQHWLLERGNWCQNVDPNGSKSLFSK